VVLSGGGGGASGGGVTLLGRTPASPSVFTRCCFEVPALFQHSRDMSTLTNDPVDSGEEIKRFVVVTAMVIKRQSRLFV